jgi:hypothetical protein
MSWKGEIELIKARSKLHESRKAIGEITDWATPLYKLTSVPSGYPVSREYRPEFVVRRLSPKLMTPYIEIYNAPIPHGEFAMDSYSGITVAKTKLRELVYPGDDDANVTGISVHYHKYPWGEPSVNRVLTVTSRGNVIYHDGLAKKFVNKVPPKKQFDTLPDEDEALLDIHSRTANGLVTAQFVVDVLEQVHKFSDLPVKGLRRVFSTFAHQISARTLRLEPGIKDLSDSKFLHL